MNDKSKMLLPQNIVDLIDALCHTRKIPQFQRDLAFATLQRVATASSEAVVKYQKEAERNKQVR